MKITAEIEGAQQKNALLSVLCDLSGKILVSRDAEPAIKNA
jgi:hypothetical protein